MRASDSRSRWQRAVASPAPIDVGVVYDRRLWLGEPAEVAGAQVYSR